MKALYVILDLIGNLGVCVIDWFNPWMPEQAGHDNI